MTKTGYPKKTVYSHRGSSGVGEAICGGLSKVLPAPISAVLSTGIQHLQNNEDERRQKQMTRGGGIIRRKGTRRSRKGSSYKKRTTRRIRGGGLSSDFVINKITANNRDVPMPTLWPTTQKAPNLHYHDVMQMGLTQPITNLTRTR